MSDPHPRRRVAALDSELSYVEVGTGPPVVFLHGNPTSSYLWRNVIPSLSGTNRVLAPDLVGMGSSAPAPGGDYTLASHIAYLDAWFEAVGAMNEVVLVAHDWGSAIAFDRIARMPEQIVAVAYLEALVQPKIWADFGDGAAMFRDLRSPEGERMILDQNFFLETVLPAGVIRSLTEEELAAYRAPYATRESRLPTLVWPREIPIDGSPADVHERVARYAEALAVSSIPKLAIWGDPGAVVTDRARDFCRGWPHHREVTVPGIHFLPEDSPQEIGAALATFVAGVRG